MVEGGLRGSLEGRIGCKVGPCECGLRSRTIGLGGAFRDLLTRMKKFLGAEDKTKLLS